jgi:hypothetical protein
MRGCGIKKIDSGGIGRYLLIKSLNSGFVSHKSLNSHTPSRSSKPQWSPLSPRTQSCPSSGGAAASSHSTIIESGFVSHKSLNSGCVFLSKMFYCRYNR